MFGFRVRGSHTVRDIYSWVVAAPMMVGSLIPSAHAQQVQSAPTGGLQVLQVRPAFYMIAGAGGNIAVQVGDDGIVVVNTGVASMSEEVGATIRRLAPAKRIIWIINTNADAQDVGGNLMLRQMQPPGPDGSRPVVLASQQTMNLMLAAKLPSTALPIDTLLLESQRSMALNGQGVEVINTPATGGNLMVFFEGSGVLVTGNVLDAQHFPVIDIADGGSIQGELDALNRILQTAIPATPYIYEPGSTIVIPGRGQLYQQPDVVYYQHMITVIRDEVQYLIGQGKTLEQIEAANPAEGYEGQYGAETGSWTTKDFIAAVYRSLIKQPAYAALERDTGVHMKQRKSDGRS